MTNNTTAWDWVMANADKLSPTDYLRFMKQIVAFMEVADELYKKYHEEEKMSGFKGLFIPFDGEHE